MNLMRAEASQKRQEMKMRHIETNKGELYARIERYLFSEYILHNAASTMDEYKKKIDLLVKKVWTLEKKRVSSSKRCGDNVEIEQQMEFQTAKLETLQLERLKTHLDKLRQLRTVEASIHTFDRTISYFHVEQYLNSVLQEPNLVGFVNKMSSSCGGSNGIDDLDLVPEGANFTKGFLRKVTLGEEGVFGRVPQSFYRGELIWHNTHAKMHYSAAGMERKIKCYACGSLNAPMKSKQWCKLCESCDVVLYIPPSSVSSKSNEWFTSVLRFRQSLQKWISTCLQSLMRTKSLQNMPYLLMHVMYLPRISTDERSWFLRFLQFPRAMVRTDGSLRNEWSEDLVDHYIAMLHLVFHPEKLRRMSILVSSGPPNGTKTAKSAEVGVADKKGLVSPEWVLLENPEMLDRYFLSDEDFVAVLNQFPNTFAFGQLFSCTSDVKKCFSRALTLVLELTHSLRAFQEFEKLPTRIAQLLPLEAKTASGWMQFIGKPTSQGVDTKALARQHLYDLIESDTESAMYLLNAVASLAASCQSGTSDERHDLVSVAVHELFMAGYTVEPCQQALGENGERAAGPLSTICLAHPWVLSLLITLLFKFHECAATWIHIFETFPINRWMPTPQDLLNLQEWLLLEDTTAPRSALARFLLDHINWEYDVKLQRLFTDAMLHRQVALMVAEALVLYKTRKERASDPESAIVLSGGGSPQKLEVTSIAKSIRRALWLGETVDFEKWCWKLMLKLRFYSPKSHEPLLPLIDLRHDRSREALTLRRWFAGASVLRVLPSRKVFPFYTSLEEQVSHYGGGDSDRRSTADPAIGGSTGAPIQQEARLLLTPQNPRGMDIESTMTTFVFSDRLDRWEPLLVLLKSEFFPAAIKVLENLFPILSRLDKTKDFSAESESESKTATSNSEDDAETALSSDEVEAEENGGVLMGLDNELEVCMAAMQALSTDELLSLLSSLHEFSYINTDELHRIKKFLTKATSSMRFWVKALLRVPFWYENAAFRHVLDVMLHCSMESSYDCLLTKNATSNNDVSDILYELVALIEAAFDAFCQRIAQREEDAAQPEQQFLENEPVIVMSFLPAAAASATFASIFGGSFDVAQYISGCPYLALWSLLIETRKEVPLFLAMGQLMIKYEPKTMKKLEKMKKTEGRLGAVLSAVREGKSLDDQAEEMIYEATSGVSRIGNPLAFGHTSLDSLSQYKIYRWCNYCLDLPESEPTQIIYWQVFFALYFATAGGSHVFGHHFLDRTGRRSKRVHLRKHLQVKLRKIVNFCSTQAQVVLTATGGSGSRASSGVGSAAELKERKYAHFVALSQLYTAMDAWMEEKDPNQWLKEEELSGLPRHYEVERLKDVLRLSDALLSSHSDQMNWSDLPLWTNWCGFEFTLRRTTPKVSVSDDNDDRIDTATPSLSTPLASVGEEDDFAFVEEASELARRHSSFGGLAGLNSLTIRPLPLLSDLCGPSSLTQLPTVSVVISKDRCVITPSIPLNKAGLKAVAMKFSENLSVLVALDSEMVDSVSQLLRRRILLSLQILLIDQVVRTLGMEHEKLQRMKKTLENEAPLDLPSTEETVEDSKEDEGKADESEELSPIQKTEQEVERLHSKGLEWFRLLTELDTKLSRMVPPLREALWRSIKQLGLSFVCIDERETCTLLQLMLEDPSRINLLSECFSPAAAPSRFVEMFAKLMSASSSSKLSSEEKLTLLRRFDFRAWLQTKSPLNPRSLIEIPVTTSGGRCGLGSSRWNSIDYLEGTAGHAGRDLRSFLSQHMTSLRWQGGMSSGSSSTTGGGELLRGREASSAASASLTNYPIVYWQRLGVLKSFLDLFTLCCRVAPEQQQWELITAFFEPLLSTLYQPATNTEGSAISAPWSQQDTLSTGTTICSCFVATCSEYLKSQPLAGPRTMISSSSSDTELTQTAKLSQIWSFYLTVLAPHAPTHICKHFHQFVTRLAWEHWCLTLEIVQQMRELVQTEKQQLTGAQLVLVFHRCTRHAWLEAQSESVCSSFLLEFAKLCLELVLDMPHFQVKSDHAASTNVLPPYFVNFIKQQSVFWAKWKMTVKDLETLQQFTLEALKEPLGALYEKLDEIVHFYKPENGKDSGGEGVDVSKEGVSEEDLTATIEAVLRFCNLSLVEVFFKQMQSSPTSGSGGGGSSSSSSGSGALNWNKCGNVVFVEIDALEESSRDTTVCAAQSPAEAIGTPLGKVLWSFLAFQGGELACLAACGRALASVHVMSQVAEKSIEKWIIEERRGMWDALALRLQVPELSGDEFEAACLEQGKLLTLQPLAEVLPSTLKKQMLRQLCDLLLELGHARRNNGIMKAIGLGGSLQYGVEFHVSCLAAGVFLRLQTRNGAPLRVDDRIPFKMTRTTEKHLKSLETMLQSKDAFQLGRRADAVVDFARDPRRSLADQDEFFVTFFSIIMMVKKWNQTPEREPEEERGVAKAFTYIKKWPAERNWAKAEELVKRDASVETLFKKTKIHPEILAKLMGPEKLSKQAIVKPSLNDYVDTQILKFKEYETLWKKSKGVL
ncbi:Ectopic P granules protein-like protein [Phytophthora cactorum]|nr:Ectopic P granules protein-like protein [Phytophthora cactorum]